MIKRISSRATILSLFLIGFISTTLCGCTRQERPVFTGPHVKLSIGIPKGESAALVLGSDLSGFFKQHGLDVTIKVFDSGVMAVEALNNGLVDLATPSDFVFASNIGKHPDLRIITTINKKTDMKLTARRDSGISTPGDLKGKRIAVTLTSIAEFYLANFLNAHRLTIQDVNTVNMSPPSMEKAVMDGNVDAAIVWSPTSKNIADSLGSRSVSWNVLSGSNWHQLLVTTENLIKKEPSAMIRLVKALILAEKSMAEDPGPVQRDLASRFGMPEKYFTGIWGENQFKISLDRSLLLALEEQSRWIQKNRGSTAVMQPNYLQYLYLDALKAVRPESVTIIH